MQGEPSTGDEVRSNTAGEKDLAVPLPVALGWTVGVSVIIVSAVLGFALWLSGGRNEATQSHAFTEFRKAALLLSDGSYPNETWPKDLPVALLRFQRFGRSVAVFGGVGKQELLRGPGIDPTTVMPGSVGNTVVIGKSTTYGAPFANLDRLAPGDQLLLNAGLGALAYQVTEVMPVRRDDPAIYETVSDTNRLSLVGHRGNPLSSQRTLVRATLVATGELAEAPMPSVPPSSTTGFAPLLLLLLAGGLGATVVVTERVLSGLMPITAARWIAAPFVLALSVPLAEQLLLALPRTW